MAGQLWQRRNGSDFVFFQSHTGFARGPVGGTYEDMLCNEFAPALHFVNVRAQRYKCQARRLVLGDQACTQSLVHGWFRVRGWSRVATLACAPSHRTIIQLVGSV